MLSLQTESCVFDRGLFSPANDASIQMITCIEDQARFCGVSLQHSAAQRLIRHRSQLQFTTLIAQYIGQIVAIPYF